MRDSYRPDVDLNGAVVDGFAGIPCIVDTPQEDCSTGVSSRDPGSVAKRCHARSGRELWKTDGTHAGTVRLEDGRPGMAGADPTFITAFNGRLFYAAASDALGRELYSTDGARNGASLVEDLRKGAASASPRYLTVGASGGALFFAADTGGHGAELWATTDDGSSVEATHVVADIVAGAGSSDPAWLTAPHDFTHGVEVLFVADDGAHGRELWATDGTAAGTALVLDICAGACSSDPQYLTPFSSDGYVYFSADDGVHGHELWVWRGGNDAVLLHDVRAGAGGSRPSFLTEVAPKYGDGTPGARAPVLAFVATDGRLAAPHAAGGYGGAQLWYADAAGGVARVADTNLADADVARDVLNLAYPPRMAVLDGTLYFPASVGHGAYEMPLGGLAEANEALTYGRGLDQALVVEDVDTAPWAHVTLRLETDSGALRFGQYGTDGLAVAAEAGKTELTGTLHAVNRAMRSLFYDADADFSGWDTVRATVTDAVPACGDRVFGVGNRTCDAGVPLMAEGEIRVYVTHGSPGLAELNSGGVY